MKKALSIILSILLLAQFIPTNVNAQTNLKTLIKEKVNEIQTKEANVKNFKSFDENVTQNQRVRIIVYLEGKSSLQLAQQNKEGLDDAVKYENIVEGQQEKIIKQLEKYGKVRHSFTTLMNAISMEVNEEDIPAIEAIKGVKKVKRINVYYPDINKARNLTNVQAAWDQNYKGEGTVVAIIDTGIDIEHQDMKVTDSSKTKLNESQVNSIISANDLKGRYFSDKVPYGYNYADDNDQIKDTTSSMHGMHVGGIVAANGKAKGVAPEAQLLAMKVFSNNPEIKGAYADDIAKAIEDSVKLKADVINMSLGSTAGYINEEDPEQIAIKEATRAGVLVVVSAGNSYYSSYPYPSYAIDPDIGLVGSPGLYPDTLQVASSENSHTTLIGFDYTSDEGTGLVGYTTSEIDPYGKLRGQFELVYCGLGRPEDFAGKNISGKIALIQRGAITFVDKKLNAQANGAVGVIVYNSAAGGDTYINMATDPRVKIPAIFITKSDGEKLNRLINKNLRISFKGRETQVANSNAEKMSDFSSWGTTPNLDFKPDVTAPGGQIYSTVNNNQYESMSGTSMAAPHASGLAALLIQRLKEKYPTIEPQNLVWITKVLLTNSAEPIIDKAAGNLPYLPRKQGAGLIKLDRALSAEVYAIGEDGKAVISLKDFTTKEKSFNIKIKNLGTEDVTLTIRDMFGPLTNKVSNFMLYPLASKINGASTSFSEQTFTLETGKEKTITVTLNVGNLPINNFVEGFIKIEDTASKVNITVPYMGFYGRWDEPRIVDSPVWDDYTYFGYTSLLDEEANFLGYLGSNQGQPIIDPDLIAFSPNGDEFQDRVMPLISLLRNAKEFKVQVLDKDKNVLKEIAVENNLRKHKNQDNLPARFSSTWAWDGTIRQGILERIAPEGEYFIRIVTKVDYYNAKEQYLDMPVKLDVTEPILNVSFERIDKNKYEFDLRGTKDNFGVMAYYLLDENLNLISKKNEDGNTKWEVVMPSIDRAYIAVSDWAGNIDVKELNLKNNIIFINNNNLSFNTTKPTFDISVKDEFKNSVNYVDVEILKEKSTVLPRTKANLGNFQVGSDLLDGLYTLKLYAVDYSGKDIAESSYAFKVDTTAPEIIVNGLTNDLIETDKSSINLTIKILDLSICSVKVNEQVKTTLPNKDLVFTLALNDGDNQVKIKAEDELGNKAEKNIIIRKLPDKPIIEITNESLYKYGKEFEVRGKVLYKDNVEVKVNGETVNVDNEGNFVKTLSYDSYGKKEVTVIAKAGELETEYKFTIVLSPLNMERYIKLNKNYTTFNVEFNPNDVSSIGITINGEPDRIINVTTESSIQIDLNRLFNGENDIVFEVTDKNNNAFKDIAIIDVDLDYPVIYLFTKDNTPLKDEMYVNKDTLVVNGFVSEPVEKLKINGNSIEVVDGVINDVNIRLNNGLNRIQIEAKDIAGNVNKYSYKVYCDTQKPQVNITLNGQNVIDTIYTEDEELVFNFDIYDNTWGYQVYLNGNQVISVEDEVGDGIGKQHDVKVKINKGYNLIDVKVVDQLGNLEERQIEVYRPINKPELVGINLNCINKNNPLPINMLIQAPANTTFAAVALDDSQILPELLNVNEIEKTINVNSEEYKVKIFNISINKEVFRGLNKSYVTLRAIFAEDKTVEIPLMVDTRSNDTSLASLRVVEFNSLISKTIKLESGKDEYYVYMHPLFLRNYRVEAEANDKNTNIVIEGPNTVPGYAKVIATAEDGTVKIYKIRFLMPLYFDQITNSELTGNEAKIIIKARNMREEKASFTFIVALFDRNNKMVEVWTEEKEVEGLNAITLTKSLNIENKKGYKVRAYILENLAPSPYSRVFEFIVK